MLIVLAAALPYYPGGLMREGVYYGVDLPMASYEVVYRRALRQRLPCTTLVPIAYCDHLTFDVAAAWQLLP